MARKKKKTWSELIIVICCIICGVFCIMSNSNNVFADDASSQGDPCYDSGIDSMAWIICPVVNNTTTTVDGIEKILRSWLTIKPQEVFINGTYQGWEIFRNFANAILIIIFLVVIFSQLTGVGIDNYGIKKLLPKLIVMAILINLSYFICEIAVDLSNILGVGLNELFKNIGENIAAATDVDLAEITIAGIVAGLLGTLTGVGAITGTVISIAAVAAGGGPMLVISLILVLIVALVSVLMFFVMLGARMMIVIVFTLIAPVAFVLYILPNTQSLFKKWWKVFQGALVVFPICGALYGAKYIIQAIVFAKNDDVDFILPLIGLCAPFLPFLLLPSLLKSALAGLGALGGSITALGNGIKKGIGKGNDALKGTNTYKDQQQENARRMQQNRAQGIIDRLNKKQNKGKTLNGREMRRLAGAHSISDKLAKEDNAAQTILTEKEFSNKTEAELQAAWNKAFDDGGDNGRLTALTNVMTSRYGTGAANFMANALASKKNINEDKKAQASMHELRDVMMNNPTFAGNMKNKASDAFQMISNAGIIGQAPKEEGGEPEPVYADLSHYSTHNGISKDVKDWSTQSADTLKRAIDSGALGEETIQQILSSTDPSVQSGIQSDPGKASVLQAALGGASGLSSMSKEDIKTFADQYKQKLKNQADEANRAAEQAAQEIRDTQRQYQEDTLNAINKINEQLGKHNGHSSGETFEGGAGI